MVNLEWYRTFKSVYKNGNFSLAAKELFYQSASCKSADINARGTRWL
jgi:DNA-binding transcriptional LysR family regulator